MIVYLYSIFLYGSKQAKMLIITSILLGFLLIVVIAYLWHIHQTYNFFTKLNIPGPPPVLFFGNFLDVIKSRRQSLTIRE